MSAVLFGESAGWTPFLLAIAAVLAAVAWFYRRARAGRDRPGNGPVAGREWPIDTF